MAFPIAVLALLFAASALAGIAPQGVSHRGRVTDFSAEPLAGVDVSCLSKGHVVGRAETDDAGAYVLKASAVACDTVSFSLEGFRTEEFRDGAPEVLDVTLRLGRMDDAPNPRVMGDVVTFQGKPARDASVWVLTLGRREAERACQAPARAQAARWCAWRGWAIARRQCAFACRSRRRRGERSAAARARLGVALRYAWCSGCVHPTNVGLNSWPLSPSSCSSPILVE